MYNIDKSDSFGGKATHATRRAIANHDNSVISPTRRWATRRTVSDVQSVQQHRRVLFLVIPSLRNPLLLFSCQTPRLRPYKQTFVSQATRLLILIFSSNSAIIPILHLPLYSAVATVKSRKQGASSLCIVSSRFLGRFAFSYYYVCRQAAAARTMMVFSFLLRSVLVGRIRGCCPTIDLVAVAVVSTKMHFCCPRSAAAAAVSVVVSVHPAQNSRKGGAQMESSWTW